MNITTRNIYLPKEELDDLNSVISGKSGIVGEHTIATYTAKFDNNIEVDIKVCGVKESLNSEEDECTPYVDAVMFDNGNEICCLEPAFDRLNGEYIFDNPDGSDSKLVVTISEKK